MAVNISPQIIEEIRTRTDIVEVISRYLPLKVKGKNYYGLCPFHAEKTPSFAVNPEKQIFHCFGCGVGGDVFGFLIKKENLSFVEAVKFLAGQCGVHIPESQSPQGLKNIENRQKLFEINEIAADYFYAELHDSKEGKEAVQYLLKRGITSQSQEQFKLGYAPTGWDGLLKYMRAKEISPPLLQQVGLVVKRENREGFYDRFRERIIFPIYDYRRRLIGFGGRCLDEKKNPPKYLNSPETPIYHKGKGFYGLNWAKESIGKHGSAIIVEGYLDLIALHQAGVKNVVASLGTAFTQEQAHLISHYAKEIVLFFDADLAGAKAATRSFPLFIGSKLRVKVAQLPQGNDPDSYVQKNGAKALSQRIEEGLPLIDFVLKETIKEVDTKSVEGQIEAANKVLPLLAQLPNLLERSSYLTKVAQRLEIKEKILLKELEKSVAKRQRTLAVDKEKLLPVQSKAEKVAQTQTLALMLRDKKYLSQGLDKLEDHDFTVPEYQEIFTVLQDLIKNGKPIDSLLQTVSGEKAKHFIAKTFFKEKEEELPEHAEKVFEDCLQALTKSRLRKKLRAMRSEALLDREVLSQYNNLLKQLKC